MTAVCQPWGVKQEWRCAHQCQRKKKLLTHVVSVLWVPISRVQKFRSSFITHVVDNRLEILSAADLLNVVNRDNAQPFTQAELDMMLAVRFHRNPSFSRTGFFEHGSKEGAQCVFPLLTFWGIVWVRNVRLRHKHCVEYMALLPTLVFWLHDYGEKGWIWAHKMSVVQDMEGEDRIMYANGTIHMI